MVDSCTVTYATGASTQDPVTGTESPEYATRFTSKCKVQSRNLTAREAEVGGRTATTVTVELHLPFSAEAVEVGDVAEITDSADPHLVGRKFRVVAPVAKSYATARRVDVEEVVA